MRDVLIPQGGWINNDLLLTVPKSNSYQLFFNGASSIAKSLGRSEVPDVFKILAINVNLFWRWMLFASRLMPYGQLPDRERELIILRVAWLCRSRYEWGQHVELGQKRAKLSDEDILNISKGETTFVVRKEQMLIRACDEMIENKTLSTSTWKELTRWYNDKLMIEITMLIGHYEMLAGVLNSAGLQLEPIVEAYYQSFNERIKNKV